MPRRRMSIRLSGGPPWGFRLSGGSDAGCRLKVAKVRPKSKAFNILKEDDVLLSINGIPSGGLSYDQAMDMLESSETDLTLDITRGVAEKEIFTSEDEPSFKIGVEGQTSEKMDFELQQEIDPKQTKATEENEFCHSEQVPSLDSKAVLNSSPTVLSSMQSLIESKEAEIAEEGLLNGSKIEVATEAEAKSATELQEAGGTSVQFEGTEDDLEKSNIEEDKQTVGWSQQTIHEPIHPEKERGKQKEEVTLTEEVIPEKEISNGQDFTITRPAATTITDTTGNNAADTEEQLSLALETVAGPIFSGSHPNGDHLKLGSDFQSEDKLEQEIQQLPAPAEEGQLAPHEKSCRIFPGGDGDGDLISDSLKDTSNSRINISPSIGKDFTMGSTGNLFKVSKFTTKTTSETWSPSGFITKKETSSYQSSKDMKVNGKDAYSKLSKPRPVSMPPSDYHFQSMDWMTSINGQQNGRAYSEEKTVSSSKTGSHHDYHRLLKVVQPPADIDQMEILLSGKKMFSSSSFYEEPHHKYPTVEEQVELCRKIADSLSADTNRLSKGASMYNKRRRRADKWVFEGPDPENEPPNNQQRNYSSSPDMSSCHYQNAGADDGTGRRKLKLVLDPRQLQDAMKLRNSGLYNEHNVISPDICFDLVKDLNSPTGKGAALFAKRKKKSEKWIVDETTVKQHEHKVTKETEMNRFTLESKSTYLEARPISALDKLIHQRLKLVKSPWEAALESPIGSCEAAFQEYHPGGLSGIIADSVLKRAEEYALSPPSIIVPPLPTVSSTTSSYLRPLTPTDSWASASPLLSSEISPGRSTTPTYTRLTLNPDIYKPKAPRGWESHRTDYLPNQATAPEEVLERPTPSPNSSLGLRQFMDFNQKPRLWTGESDGPALGFKPVRPPSLLFK